MKTPTFASPSLSKVFAALIVVAIACGLCVPLAFADDSTQGAITVAQIESAGTAGAPEVQAADDIDSGTWGTCPWRIDKDGTLWVSPGKSPDYNSYAYPNWYTNGHQAEIKKAVFLKGEDGSMVVDRGMTGNLGSIPLFENMVNLEEVDLAGLDIAHMEHDCNLSNFFSGCKSLKSVDLSPLDTSKVTDMAAMFRDCASLVSVDMSMLDLSSMGGESSNSSVTNGMHSMFSGCKSLTSVKLPSSSKIGKLPSTAAMFKGCSALETLDLSQLDTSKTREMDCMFEDCESLKTIYVGDKWSTVAHASYGLNLDRLFLGCVSLEGGSGTVYDANRLGCEYARIDTPDTPGYLTRKGQPAFRDLNYRFSNSYEGFGYPRGYVIPLKRYELLFGSKRAKLFQEADGEWGGNCYGMSSSSSMMNVNGSGVLASGFDAAADAPRALGVKSSNASIGLNLTEFIEVMQVSQHADAYGDAFYNNVGLKNVVDFVRSQTAETRPAIVGVFRTPMGGGGHAILAYGVEKASDGGWQILVYDNNWPQHGRSIYVSSDYRSWTYELWEGMTYTNGRLVYFPYNTYADVWNDRNANKTGGATNVLSTNSRDFNLYDASGNLVATVQDGVLQDGAAAGVWQHEVMRVTEENAADELGVVLTFPNGLARVENKDASLDKLKASVSDQEQIATVKTSADSVELAVDDSTASTGALLAPGSGAYEITMESALPQAKGKEVVEVSGLLTASGASVSMMGGALDTSKAAGATVKINGKIQTAGIADGKTSVVGGATYKVTSNAKGTAVYQRAPKSKGSVIVPATVTINGKSYQVVGIAKNAFKGTKAKTVTIKTAKLTKKSVRGCFKGAKKLKTVKVKVGSKSANKKALKRYKKILTKKNAGKKVKVK